MLKMQMRKVQAMTSKDKVRVVKAWAVVRDGYLQLSHLSPEISAYQIFDTPDIHSPYMNFDLIEVEIRPLTPTKRKQRRGR